MPTRPRSAPLSALLALILLVGPACRDARAPAEPDAVSGAAAPEAAGEVPGIEGWSVCRSEDLGLSVPYPAGWWTNSDAALGAPCRYFHPEPLDVTPGVEQPPMAVDLNREPMSLERWEAGVLAEAEAEVLERGELQVAGRRAVRVETRTGPYASRFAPGTRLYTYAVELDAGRMLRGTVRSDAGDYERNRAVLDHMMEGLILQDP